MACGFDLNNLKANLAQNFADYNYLVSKFNKIPIPANIKFLQKCAELYHGIYLDEEGSSMAQSYAFVPYTFWTFDEAYDTNGSGLRTEAPVGYTANPYTGFMFEPSFGAYLTYLEKQIDAILNSTTFNYIYADILRCNEKNGLALLKLNEVPTDYGILPSKVEELSEWLNNMVILGEPADSTTMESAFATPKNDVSSNANKNAINYHPDFFAADDLTGFKFLMNWKYENPTMESKINSSRLYQLMKCAPSTKVSGLYFTTDVTLADHYAVRLAAATDDSTSADKAVIMGPVIHVGNYSAEQWAELVGIISKFDWHPYVYVINKNTHALNGVIGDLQFYTTLEFNMLHSLNDVATMSLFELK
jgi:hypothetical protein